MLPVLQARTCHLAVHTQTHYFSRLHENILTKMNYVQDIKMCGKAVMERSVVMVTEPPVK